jgi:hypothetical protein
MESAHPQVDGFVFSRPDHPFGGGRFPEDDDVGLGSGERRTANEEYEGKINPDSARLITWLCATPGQMTHKCRFLLLTNFNLDLVNLDDSKGLSSSWQET